MDSVILKRLTVRSCACSGCNKNKNSFHSHSIPCEGYLAWTVANRYISGFLFKLRTGCNYSEEGYLPIVLDIINARRVTQELLSKYLSIDPYGIFLAIFIT